MREEFDNMPFDQKVSYLVENLSSLPDELAEQGVEVLVQAREIEYAVVLARDKGMIKKAIRILVDEGDYLWAALIAKNAGMAEESEQLYRMGLDYYVDMEMYGRAISAATALKLSADEIDDLFRRGIQAESRSMDLDRTRAVIEGAMDSVEIALMGKEDEMSQNIMNAIQSEREKMVDREKKKEKEETGE